MLNWFLNSGTAASPVDQPGEVLHYSDTGYVILGLLVERLSGRSPYGELRERIFRPLTMKWSYLEYADDPDARLWRKKAADFHIGEVTGVDVE